MTSARRGHMGKERVSSSASLFIRTLILLDEGPTLITSINICQLISKSGQKIVWLSVLNKEGREKGQMLYFVLYIC